MLLNYLKIAFRSLLKRKLYTLINVFGLSMAMGCAVVGYLNYEFNTSWDRFHERADRIYRLGSMRVINGADVRYGIVPSMSAEIIKSMVTGVDRVVEYEINEGIVRIGDHLFNERLFFSTPDFFEMFTFGAMAGNPAAALSTPDQVVISREYAEKYFGNEPAVGKQVSIRIGNNEAKPFVVGAVMDKWPVTSSVQFDMLLNLHLLEELKLRQVNDWRDWVGSVFFETSDPSAADRIVRELNTHVAAQNSASPTLKISGYYTTPLLKVAAQSRDIRNNMLVRNPPFSSFIGSLSMAGIILLLACFNYVNTSLAYAAVRLKEVGIRKVVGGGRAQIILQFLGEQIVLCSLALVAGLGIAELLIKGWNYLWSWNPLALQYTDNIPLIVFLFSLVLVIAVVAGFYPAYYVSRFRPVEILKGRTLHARINHFMRGMLVLQFALSLIAIIQAVAFTENAKFVETIDMGFQRENRVMIPLEDDKLYEPFRDALIANSSVRRVTSGQDHVFFGFRRRPVSLGEQSVETDVLRVEDSYPAVMDFRLKRGRLFDPELGDESRSVVVTESLVRALALGDGLGATVEVEEERYTIVGVLEDFMNRGVWDPSSPVLFRSVKDKHDYVIVEMKANPDGATASYIKETWNKINPNQPYSGEYQDIIVMEAARVSQNITMMNLLMGFLAFTMATLGLFSLVSLKVVRRTKEIGVRKVLGAGTAHILTMMNREFIVLIVIAIVVGNGLGYWLTSMLLGAIYAYHGDVGMLAMGLASASSMAIAILTGGWVVLKVARANPVGSLRYE